MFLFLTWLGVLLPPFAWSLQLTVRYAYLQLQCVHSTHMTSDITAAAALAVAIAGGLLAWRNRRQLNRPPEGETHPFAHRARFMSTLGLWLSAMFVLVIIAQWLPERVLSSCPQ